MGLSNAIPNEIHRLRYIILALPIDGTRKGVATASSNLNSNTASASCPNRHLSPALRKNLKF